MNVRIAHTVKSDPITFNDWAVHIHNEYKKITQTVGRVKGYDIKPPNYFQNLNNTLIDKIL